MIKDKYEKEREAEIPCKKQIGCIGYIRSSGAFPCEPDCTGYIPEKRIRKDKKQRIDGR